MDENGEPMVVDGVYLNTSVDLKTKMDNIANKVEHARKLYDRIQSEADGDLETFIYQSDDNAEEVFRLEETTSAILEKMLKGEPVEPAPVVAFRYGDIREEESERLVKTAKGNNLYFGKQEIGELGGKQSKKTG